jgi:hypothetical protein
MRLAALADVDAGRLIDHQTIQAWIEAPAKAIPELRKLSATRPALEGRRAKRTSHWSL